MKGMIPPTQWITAKETLKDVTSNVLKTLFVPIPKDENIQLRTCQIYGIPGTGKTSLYRWFGFKGLQHYTKDNINLIESTNLDVLLDSIEPVPVNFLFLEDAGLETQSAGKELIAKFTRVRHIHGDVLEDKGKERKGIDDVFFNVQDPFLLEKKLRSTLHVEILKNAPTNDYDKGILVKNMGKEALKRLEFINKRVFQQYKYEYLSHCVARAIDDVGHFIYDFIPSKDSVIRRIEPSPFVLGDKYKKIPLRTVDSVFLSIFRDGLSDFLQNYTENEEHIRYYVDYYASDEKHTHQSIAEMYNINPEEEKGRDAIRQAIKRLREKIIKEDHELTKLGHVLEKALEEHLNRSQQNFVAGTGGSHQPDLLLKEKDLAINCKYRHTPETTYYNLESTPENKHKFCWLAIYDRDHSLRFHENRERLPYITVHSKEGVSVGNFLEHVKKYYSATINCPECGKPMTTEDHNFYHCSNCPTTYVPDGSILFDEEDKNDS